MKPYTITAVSEDIPLIRIQAWTSALNDLDVQYSL